MSTSSDAVRGSPTIALARSRPHGRLQWRRGLGLLALVVGAVLFLFPFYYMIVGALQLAPDTGISGAFPSPGNLTLGNFADINAQVDLVRTLINSGIFTAGVLLGTFFIGLLADKVLFSPWESFLHRRWGTAK